MLKKITLILLINLMGLASAHANILFSPSITYMEQSQQVAANPESQAKLTVIDMKLGYVFDFGLYVGGFYSIQDHDFLSDSSDSYLGPSVGYYNSGFLAVGTYYIFGEKDFTDGSGKMTGVNGFQIDVAYAVPVTDNFRIGPQLTYQSVEFDTLEVNGFDSSVDYEFSSITPYFNLMFLF